MRAPFWAAIPLLVLRIATMTSREASSDELDFDGVASADSSFASKASTVSSIRRTKTQRQKLRGERARLRPPPPAFQADNDDDDEEDEEDDESRKVVRFSLSPTKGSFASEGSSYVTRRRRKARDASWQIRDDDADDDDDNDDETSTRNDSLPRSSMESLSSGPQMRQAPSILKNSFKTNPVRGAGGNVFAVQDAGSYRMLFDECTYLASTILSSYNAAEAACELAMLLSNRKTRSILLAASADNFGGTTALDAILEVLSEIPKPPTLNLEELKPKVNGGGDDDDDEEDEYSNFNSQDSEVSMLSVPDDDLDGSQDFSGHDSIGSISPQDSKKKKRSRTRTSRKRRTGMSRRKGVKSLDEPGVEALAAIVHFLSWDCTTSLHSASTSASSACKVRKKILMHKGGMRGIVHLAVHDPVVTATLQHPPGRMRGMMHDKEPKNPGSMGGSESTMATPEKETTEEANGDDKSPGSTNSLDLEAADPTSSGRRRRKRRRILFDKVDSHLQMMKEGGEISSTAQNRMGGSSLSFASSSSSVSKPVAPEPENERLSFVSSGQSEGSITTEVEANDNVSVATCDSAAFKIAHLLPKVRAALALGESGLETREGQHSVYSNGAARLPSMLALDAVVRIIQGKEGDENPCFDASDADSEVKEKIYPADDGPDTNSEDDMEASNPLLMTNTLLLQSETLPIFATSMAEAIASWLKSRLASDSSNSRSILYLHGRISILAALIDGACCLSKKNRDAFSSRGDLLVGILRVLHNINVRLQTPTIQEPVSDTDLTLMRTLTSITHENDTAAAQLMMTYSPWGSVSTARGVETLMELLFRVVMTQSSARNGNKKPSQLHYDLTIFCLNTLANVIEFPGVKKILAEFSVCSSDTPNGKLAFLPWLTKWVVGETATFRNDIMHGSFGQRTEKSGEDKQELSDELDKEGQEHLVMAGNGFVLLACLLSVEQKLFHQDLQKSIREKILRELPENQNGGGRGGVTIMKNTLKAFCNFYHYSVGDLSVAVVAPVKKLINQLEQV